MLEPSASLEPDKRLRWLAVAAVAALVLYAVLERGALERRRAAADRPYAGPLRRVQVSSAPAPEPDYAALAKACAELEPKPAARRFMREFAKSPELSKLAADVRADHDVARFTAALRSSPAFRAVVFKRSADPAFALMVQQAAGGSRQTARLIALASPPASPAPVVPAAGKAPQGTLHPPKPTGGRKSFEADAAWQGTTGDEDERAPAPERARGAAPVSVGVPDIAGEKDVRSLTEQCRSTPPLHRTPGALDAMAPVLAGLRRGESIEKACAKARHPDDCFTKIACCVKDAVCLPTLGKNIKGAD